MILGNNRIESIEQVIRFRQLKNLRMLTLSDNPISRDNPDYKNYVMAYVDTIKYLDYALIDPVQRDKAKYDAHDELIDIIEKESVLAEKITRETAMQLYIQKLDQACILFAHTLFDDLFNDDGDLERLKHMPGVKEQVELFRTSFKTSSEEYIRNSLEKYEKKKHEVHDFNRAVKLVRSRDDLDSTKLIGDFNKSKKVEADKITHINSTLSQVECQRIVKRLQDELDQVGITWYDMTLLRMMMMMCTYKSYADECDIACYDIKIYMIVVSYQRYHLTIHVLYTQVCDELMNIELRQVEKFEALIDDFENRLTDLKTEALEAQQLFFRAVEDLEEKFSTGIRAVATDLIERLAREELPDEYLDDEAMGLVVDKETCMNVLSASHDMHISRILKREDEARGSETKRFQETMSSYFNEESARNRDRVLQVSVVGWLVS